MRYEGAVIRPPSEADSLILQVTLGCSNNTCDFCGTYLGKPFRVRPYEEVVADIEGLPAWYKRDCRRVFLADGDALDAAAEAVAGIVGLFARATACVGEGHLLRQCAELAEEVGGPVTGTACIRPNHGLSGTGVG